MCEVCTAPRPGYADDDKKNRPPGIYHGDSVGGGGGSASSQMYQKGDEDPINKFIFSKTPYPEHLIIEWEKGEQADVWIEGLGWCVGTIVVVKADKACFHVNNYSGGIWKEKTSEQLAPLNTQTHYYDHHFLKKVSDHLPSDPSKALVPYVEHPNLSSNSVPSTMSSSTPFIQPTTTTTTTTTITPTQSSTSTLGVIPEVPEKDGSEKVESPPVNNNKEKKINLDNQPSSQSFSTPSSSSINESIVTQGSHLSSGSTGGKDSNPSHSISAPSMTSTTSTGSGSSSSQSGEEEATWECLMCTYRNLDRAANCILCQTIRYQDEI